MRRSLSPSVFAALVISFCCTGLNAQQIELTYGNNNVIDLVADAANQRVDFFVENIAGKNYDTMSIFVQIGDGGSPAGGTDTGPGLSDIELAEPGTIFAGGTVGGFGSASQTPLLWADQVAGVVATTDGFAGTFVFDSTGFGVGTVIDIRFESIGIDGNTLDTNFRGVANEPESVTSASNGIIRIVAVPEPGSTAVLLAVTGFFGVRRRRLI